MGSDAYIIEPAESFGCSLGAHSDRLILSEETPLRKASPLQKKSRAPRSFAGLARGKADYFSQ